MNPLPRITLIYFAPSIVGMLTASLMLFAYSKLGVAVQLEPAWLEAIRLILLFIAGLISAALFYSASTLAKHYKFTIAFALCLWALFHTTNVESQSLSYLGAGCCEERKSSLLNVVDSIINPFFPFINFLR